MSVLMFIFYNKFSTQKCAVYSRPLSVGGLVENILIRYAKRAFLDQQLIGK